MLYISILKYAYIYKYICKYINRLRLSAVTFSPHRLLPSVGVAFLLSFSNTAVVLYEFIANALFCIHNAFENLFYATKWHTDPTRLLHIYIYFMLRIFSTFYNIGETCRLTCALLRFLQLLWKFFEICFIFTFEILLFVCLLYLLPFLP